MTGKKREGCTYLGPAEPEEMSEYIDFSLKEPTKIPFAPMETEPCFSISMVGTKWVFQTRREVNDSHAFDAVAALHRQRSRR